MCPDGHHRQLRGRLKTPAVTPAYIDMKGCRLTVAAIYRMNTHKKSLDIACPNPLERVVMNENSNNLKNTPQPHGKDNEGIHAPGCKGACAARTNSVLAYVCDQDGEEVPIFKCFKTSSWREDLAGILTARSSTLFVSGAQLAVLIARACRHADVPRPSKTFMNQLNDRGNCMWTKDRNTDEMLGAIYIWSEAAEILAASVPSEWLESDAHNFCLEHYAMSPSILTGK
jgi:hypothetical protein